MLPSEEQLPGTVGSSDETSDARVEAEPMDSGMPGCFLERLPSEILWYLSRFLDLASIIILSTATSRTLKTSFLQFSRPSLYLEPMHRLSLAEWRSAAHELVRLGLTSRDPTTVKHVSKKPSFDSSEDLRQTCQMLSKDDSLVDLHLLQDVLTYLQTTSESSLRTKDAKEDNEPRLHCLSLLGWHGIAGSFLVNQLRTQPLLSGVRTVVKTERADSRIWQQVAVDGQRKELEPHEQVSIMRRAREEASTRLSTRVQAWRPESLGPTKPFYFKTCIKTQAIVQVGRRRPRQAGQPYLKGEGLQIGYESYCLSMANSAGASATTLHVILQGREAPDSEASKETAYMLERSIITCNHCKERIVF